MTADRPPTTDEALHHRLGLATIELLSVIRLAPPELRLKLVSSARRYIDSIEQLIMEDQR